MPPSFRDLLLHEIAPMRAWARSLCHDKDRADDLVQDALLAAWRHRDRLADHASIRPWLFRIVRNLHLKSLARSARRDVPLADSYEVSDEGAAEAAITRSQQLHHALYLLSAAERHALVLVFVNELTCEEAAVICKCPPGTVKSRLSRARRRLRSLLGDVAPAPKGPPSPQPEIDLEDQSLEPHSAHDFEVPPPSAAQPLRDCAHSGA